jgi:hypothetical protein
MKTIFIDECGYTGEDLANPEQPVFTVATHSFSEEKCLSLKKKFFAEWGDDEIKHTLIQSNPQLLESAIHLLEELALEDQEVKIGLTHKQYVLVSKMVDLLVEPAMHNDGINLYKDGGHIALSNLLFQTYRLGGDKFFNALTKKFQNMMRRRNAQEYRRFFEFVYEKHPIPLVDDALVWLRAAHHKLGSSGIFRDLPPNSIDITLTLSLSVMAQWRANTTDEIQVIHDRSTTMSKQKRFWAALTDPTEQPTTVGSGLQKFTYPIAVKGTKFEPAANWAGLQIADLLAGATTHLAKKTLEKDSGTSNKNYEKALSTIFANSFGGHTIWPSTKISPDELGAAGTDGEDIINHVAKLMLTKKIKPT